MLASIVNGKIISEIIIRQSRMNLVEKMTIKPTLEIILTQNCQTSLKYIKMKKRKAEKIGINLYVRDLSNEKSLTTGNIVDCIRESNMNNLVNGIMLQFPLRYGLDGDVCVSAINKDKDVDGLNDSKDLETCKTFNNNWIFLNPVALGIYSILSYMNSIDPKISIAIVGSGRTVGEWSGPYVTHFYSVTKIDKLFINLNVARHPVVLNFFPPPKRIRSGIIIPTIFEYQFMVVRLHSSVNCTLPASKLLKSKGFPVILLDSKTKNQAEICQKNDIIICCSGKPNHITKEFIHSQLGLIDAGSYSSENGTAVYGFDHETVFNRKMWVSPPIGGLGPLTVAWLLYNTIESYVKFHNLSLLSYSDKLEKLFRIISLSK